MTTRTVHSLTQHCPSCTVDFHLRTVTSPRSLPALMRFPIRSWPSFGAANRLHHTLLIHTLVYLQVSLSLVIEPTLDDLMILGTTWEEAELYDGNGPLWYRGWALESEEQVCADVDQVLAKTGTRRMIMGHTPDFTVTRAQLLELL
jgi:hypothetical protein